MNASARKELPAPDPLDLGAAMARRYQTAEEEAAPEATDEAAAPPSQDATKPRRRDVTKSPRREAAKPQRRDASPPRSEAPSAADSVALTVRFEPEAYEDLDDWLRALRRELGWRKLDKSLVVRTLLEVAQARADVRRALLQALQK